MELSFGSFRAAKVLTTLSKFKVNTVCGSDLTLFYFSAMLKEPRRIYINVLDLSLFSF